MHTYNEDEIRILRQLTDEVFVISNKPQLAVVQKMKQVQCDIMNTGLRKVKMDIFYCKTCDKEHKYSICKTCTERCHKGHQIVDYVKGSDDHPAMCMCGFKCHNMLKKKNEDIEQEQNTMKCYFNQLSLNTGAYEHYVAINGRQVCSFCYHFCCHSLLTNEDDEESRKKAFKKYQFKKISSTKEEFETQLEQGTIKCECLTLNDSKHKSADYLYVFLNDLNIPNVDDTGQDNYFSELQPTKIINLFFSSTELFESIYNSFINEFNEFSETLTMKNMTPSITTTLGVAYANFANNANNCQYNFYFNEKINCFFTTNTTKCLLEKNLKINEHNNTFLINYLRGYTKFRMGSYLESLPRYLLTDMFNLNPFQRRIWKEKCREIFYNNGLAKESLIKSINSHIERLIRQKPEFEDSIEVFIALYRIVKIYARFFFLSREEIIETCKVLDDLFGYLADSYSNEETKKIKKKEERAKLFKTIIKIILYFALYINDETFFAHFDIFEENSDLDVNEKVFFQSFTESSKLANKILVHVAEGVRREYEVATFLRNMEEMKRENAPEEKVLPNEDDDDQDLSNEEFQISLMRILYFIQLNFDFTLQQRDVYLTSFKRAINQNLKLYLDILRGKYDKEENSSSKEAQFGKLVADYVNHLELLYYDFFNRPLINFDLIQEYIAHMTHIIISNFDGNYENFIDKQNGIYTCEYMNIFKPNEMRTNWKMTCEFMLNKSPSVILSITKIFKLSRDKTVFTDEVCRNIIKICFAFINDNPDNVIIGLSVPVLKNLSKIPKTYLCCILDYMIFGVKILIKYNTELSFGFYLAKMGFLIYHKTTSASKSNKGKNRSELFFCLVRLFKLLELIFSLNILDQKQFMDFIKPNLEDFVEEDLIKCYKFYLLEIAKDFQEHRKYYTSKRIFDNTEFFEKQFKEYIQLTNTFNASLMGKIFFRLMKLLTKTFDVDALDTIPDFLKSFLNQQELFDILNITTIDIELRVEFIKYFRMLYVDLSIDTKKLDLYRFAFHEELDAEVQKMNDSLLSPDSMRVFIFLQRLLKVSHYDFDSRDGMFEMKMLFFEVKNFKKIVMNAKHCDKKVYLNYIENGIILPIKVYLNKVLSNLMIFKGESLLQLYRFCYYILKMKEFIIESSLIEKSDNQKKCVFRAGEFTNEKALIEVKEDIEMITNPTFPVLNYREIYQIINKHVMSLVEEPTSAELVLYLSEYDKFEANQIAEFKQELIAHAIDFEDSDFANIWKAYESYLEQKNNLDKSSLKANFDDTFINGEITVRVIVMRYLFFLSTNKVGIFEEEGVKMLLKLLKHEPDESQEAIFKQSVRDETKYSNAGKKKKLFGEQVDKKSILRQRQIQDFYYMAKTCFDNLLSSIFSQYNPTSLELSDKYYYVCRIIKVFKYLCEAHNQQFQKRLMNEISFSIGRESRIKFYDMMLFILDKIIIISSWETTKIEEEVQDYYYGLFSCMIELLIEIVRGADVKNFRVFLSDESDEEDERKKEENKDSSSRKQSEESPQKHPSDLSENTYNKYNVVRRNNRKLTIQTKGYKYEKGKALKVFLQNIKVIMFENASESETIMSARKNLMDFILSFMEEVNCPRRIQNLIMSYYTPNMVIKSICIVLKIYYLKEFLFADDKEKNIDDCEKNKSEDVNSRVNTEEKKDAEEKKGNKTGKMIVDHRLKKTQEKAINKMLKQLKFNNELCTHFIRLYFENPEFSQSKYFELCNVYYKYFLLTYIQFKSEETIDFWNRIQNNNEEIIYDFDKRTKITKEFLEKAQNSSANDESDIEFYYVMKFFNEITKHVLVKSKQKAQPVNVIYTIHPLSKYLSSDSKDEFLRNVDRKNRYTKLYDLIETSQYFQLEILYNLNFLKGASFLRFSTKINYHLLGYVIFALSFMINLLLLIFTHESGEEIAFNFSLSIVFIICYLSSGLSILIIIFWFLTKYQLYYNIEKAKYKAHHNDKTNIDDSKLTVRDRFNITWEAVISKGELNAFFIFALFTLIGSIFRGGMFFISFGLLSILSLSQTLNNILMSIFLKGNSLMWTTLFTLVLLYEYAGWAYYYQSDRFYETQGRDKPEEMCRTLLYCYLTMINNGMRWHAGVGKITRSESGLKHFWPFVHRFIFDLLFFWLIEAMMLKIVYGIILDSFGELRQKHYLIEKDIANNCFICHIEKDECEKNNISFIEHCEKVHNVWDYVFYMITLRMTDPTKLSAIDSRNREKLMNKNIDWLPDSSIDKLMNRGEKDEVEEKDSESDEEDSSKEIDDDDD